MKKDLPTVTLLGIDCVDIDRLVQAAEICMKDFNFAEVKLLTSLPAKDIDNIIPIKPINTVEEYSKFVIAELNNYVETENVLIIQYDGFILNPEAWTDKYLEYDYMGSPLLINDWSIRTFNLDPKTNGDWVVGNGGFCLRSKKLLEELQRMNNLGEFDEHHAEDVVICIKKREYLESKGFKFAPIDLAERFSFEHSTSDNKIAWTNEFGFHGLKWSDISAWIQNNPHYNIKNNVDRKSYEE